MDNHRKWFVNCVYMDNMRRKRGGSVRDQLVQEGGENFSRWLPRWRNVGGCRQKVPE